MRRVLKYGGTSIESADRVRRAAQNVARLCHEGEQIAVVVSAQGNDTNQLLHAVYGVTERQVDAQAVYRVAAMGEEKSVHLMTAALRSLGVEAVPLYPVAAESWPLIVDVEEGGPLAAQKINEERGLTVCEEESRRLFQRHVVPVLRRGAVPVISGFFGRDRRGELSCLGRGGSDISGVLTGRFVDADEIIIITDVEGILSADPRLLGEGPGARLVGQMSVADLELLASRGARVVHPRALRYLPAGARVRVLDYRQQEGLSAEALGTTLWGSGGPLLSVREEALCMVTLVGRELSRRAGLLAELAGALARAGISIAASNSNDSFVCFYLFARDAEPGYRLLHEALLQQGEGPLQNVTLRRDVAELRLRSPEFLQTPGVLAELTAVLARRRVNILEIITSLTDIYIYVDFADREAARELLQARISPAAPAA